MNAIMRHMAVACFVFLQSRVAHAAAFQIPDIDPLMSFLTLAAVAVFFWAFRVVRLLSQSENKARQRISELEIRLNEAETAFAAEAHVMIVWHGKEEFPSRVIGSMYGSAKVPTVAADMLNFPAWLEADSSNVIEDCIRTLREVGKPFNIGVKTLNNELLEADGRVAGGMATLRFRPLSGERRQITELNYDVRKLGMQVERLSAVLDSAPLPIWLRDGEGRLSWVNRAYVKAVELPDSAAVLRSLIEVAAPDRIDTTKADPKVGLLGRAHAVFAGAMRALNIHEVALPEGRAGFAVDVSELEDIEKELDRHIKAHASTLNKLDTAIAIFGPDQRLRFHNMAFAQLWPLDGQWLDMHPTDGEILDRLRTQRCIPEQANYREWRAKQLSSYTTLEMRESWWYLPDGRSLHVVCEQHPFGGVTYLYENVTKEIQLESRYNELIGVQRETLDNLEEAIALFGSDGRLKLFNPAFSKFWNFDGAFLQKEPHVDQLVSDAAVIREAGAAWQEIKFGITGMESERRALRGRLTASDRILQYSSVPLPDGNTLLTFSDISDPAKMERALRDRTEALEAADRLKNAFLSNVSYEVRTPLTSILGFAETLDLGLVGELSPKQREYVLDIKRSSEELKAIIDAIIDLSAIDAGAMELKLARLDVAELLQAVAEKLSPTMTRRDQTLSIELAEDSLAFVGDAMRVEQIVSNLLSNAIGFSARGSQVRMGAKRSGTNIQIWIADSGRGIDPEFQKKAFERFQSKPLPGSHRGPGLGLSIVKSFTELHGGNVSLISKLDRGTTVVCSFPVDGPAKQNPRNDQAERISPQRVA
ncbi:MAG: PAS-domain containing protein [Rhizobiales bacterium]|nr:PAS-domain containing protein [Hyphomicrobiales bacterium]MBP9175463.1 PAS-domain containing protein [Hyphomicrobiales bacterium]